MNRTHVLYVSIGGAIIIIILGVLFWITQITIQYYLFGSNKRRVHDACSELQKFIEDVKAQNTNADQYLIKAAENIKRINKCKT